MAQDKLTDKTEATEKSASSKPNRMKTSRPTKPKSKKKVHKAAKLNPPYPYDLSFDPYDGIVALALLGNTFTISSFFSTGLDDLITLCLNRLSTVESDMKKYLNVTINAKDIKKALENLRDALDLYEPGSTVQYFYETDWTDWNGPVEAKMRDLEKTGVALPFLNVPNGPDRDLIKDFFDSTKDDAHTHIGKVKLQAYYTSKIHGKDSITQKPIYNTYQKQLFRGANRLGLLLCHKKNNYRFNLLFGGKLRESKNGKCCNETGNPYPIGCGAESNKYCDCSYPCSPASDPCGGNPPVTCS